MRTIALAALLAVGPGTARATCDEPFTTTQFEALVDQADDTILHDDVAGHEEVYRELEARVPCLQERVPTPTWARFLVGLAVVEHAVGGDWRAPLYAAVTAWPGVPRDYGPEEVQGWQPDPAPSPGPALPAGPTFWVDGVEVERAPPLRGVHIVQRRQGDHRESALVRRGPFPEPWLAPAPSEEQRADPPGAPGLRATVSMVTGYGGVRQEGLAIGQEALGIDPVLAGIGTDGTWLPRPDASPFGVFWDVAALYAQPTAGAEPGHAVVDAYGGVAVDLGPLHVLPGAGISTFAVADDGNPSLDELVVLPRPHLGAGTRLPLGRYDLDLGAGGGWLPSGHHVRGRATLVGGKGALRWSVGPEVVHAQARLTEGATGDPVVTAPRWHAGLRVGLQFGR